ncbi:ATP-binding protein [Rubrobacter radiotolerans]|uniref:ATP-binding protein n=1 Tax=Rubrobacter radiotolerans TaxID=42256 RepID=A0AB35TA41_RUBRA|nr:ATP-binding protein [Rubrobacter radiotolerans]MDX5895208.1 ATP-binding protein [Rubrobacter radiotolerans]
MLWAARRALRLLDLRSNLQRVVMEGVTPLERVDSEDDGFLGVDLTEYFGGNNLAEARRVVTTQLKYSTRHPEQAWTDARLRERGSSSVLQRLANVYKTFADEHGRAEVIRRLSVRLLSNQPAEEGLLEASIAAREELTGLGTAEVKTATLLKRLSPQQAEMLRRLHDASRLRSVEFTDFLRVFDLSGCGEEGRLVQRLRLLQELAPLVTNDPVEGLRNLKEIIEHEAQPETAGSVGLTKVDVLAALGVGREDDLFPAPPALKPTPREIRTAEARSLAAVVAGESEGRKVLAHGDAGVGKTTTVQAMQAHLPEGSVTVIYDCYGGGQYLVAGEQRHTNGRAFQQLINEFAMRCGTPFLVRVDGEVSDIQRRFSRTLAKAAEAIEADGGLLVIVIDAADNAVFAARRQGDICFVPPFWTFSLPDNVRLLMTCRTHRRGELEAPEGVYEYELRGFDEEASAAHLRRVFPDAGDTQCRVFHESTSGNPRLQFYLLERAESQGSDALDQVLSAAERTPDDIFDDLFDAAIAHASDPDQARQQAALLVCLSQPSPTDVFAEVCEITPERASNFCRALVPGLVIEDDGTRFRDEDFETYLRGKVGEDALEAAEARLGEHFLSRADSDTYAAGSVADHLFAAERYGDVIALALEGPEPTAIQDDMARLRVLRRRVTLAMRSTSAADREDQAVRLTLLAAELARSNEAANSVIMEQPGLASIYGNPDDVARLYLRDPDKPWLGPAHFEIARVYAREPSYRNRAEEQLRMADAWIRRWQALPENERFDWRLIAEDVAAGAEAVYRLGGAEEARDWLMRWRPRIVRLHAAYDLVKELAAREDVPTLEKQLTELGLPVLVEAALLAALSEGGDAPSRESVESVARRLDLAGRRGRNHEKLGSGWAATFCELHAFHGLDSGRTLRLLRIFEPPFPPNVPSEYSDLSDHDVPLRIRCLRAALEGRELTIDELIPERYRAPQDAGPHSYDPNESERRTFRQTIGKVLGAYRIRAMTIAQRLTVAEVRGALEPQLSDRRSDIGHRWFRFDRRYEVWARRAGEALIRAEGDAGPHLTEIADLAEQAIRAAAPGLWIDLAERMLRSPTYRSLGYRLVERAAQAVASQPTPGRDRWETLLRCAATVDPYDAALSRDLYLRAVGAAESLDDESALLLRLHTRCARTAASGFSEERRRDLAARMARLLEAHEGYVSEPSVLPWEATLGAAAALHPAGGLALCSRWDDEDRLLIRDGIAEVVRATTDAGYLSAEEGLHLLRLAAERFDVSEDAVRLMERVRTLGASARPRLVAMIKDVSTWVLRDVPLNRRQQAASRVVKWADDKGVGTLPGVAKLREVLRFLETLSGEENESTSSSSSIRPNPEYEARLRKEEESEANASAEALREALADAQEGKFDDLLQRRDTYERGSYRAERSGDPDFLNEVWAVVPPSSRERYLDALTDLGDDALTARLRMHKGLPEALHRALDAWRGSSAAQAWTTRGIRKLLDTHLPGIVAYDYNARQNLRVLLSLPGLKETITSLLLPAVAEHVEGLDARSLYDVADVLVADLSPDKQGGALAWSIERSEERIVRDRGSLPDLPLEPTSDQAHEALAGFLWAAFGHPWKPVRWRAAHAARSLLLLPSPDLLRALVLRSNSETAGTFRSGQLDFFWMSARSWLMVVLQRLAEERPEVLQPHVEDIAQHTLSSDFPHAQIRELAKRTVLRVVEHDPAILPRDEIEKLQHSNEPGSGLYPRQSPYDLGLNDRLKDNSVGERFGFNSMDTIPYWYAPLGRVFAQNADAVTARAEAWVCDRWGRTHEDWWNDPRELRSERTTMYASNNHGSMPRMENLKLYLEYHAMQCVAGEMVDILPVSVDKDDSDFYSWDSWLEEHLPAHSRFWLADLRSTTPFRGASWGYFPPMEEWFRRDDPAEYEAALGIGEPGDEGEIVVDGSIQDHDSRRRGRVSVSSALVSPDTAAALLRALQTTDPGNFRLPYAGEEDEYGVSEISEPGFVLKGLVTGWRREKEYLDEHDPLTREIKGSFSLLGRDFLDTLGVSLSDDFLTYSEPNGNIVARLDVWSDDPQERERITEAFSTGERLWVRTEALLDYLRCRSMDLVMEVQITRNVERRYDTESYLKEREYDPGRSTIYILRGDGSLETLAGRRPLGSAHSP